jgi:hypothetical protein
MFYYLTIGSGDKAIAKIMPKKEQGKDADPDDFSFRRCKDKKKKVFDPSRHLFINKLDAPDVSKPKEYLITGSDKLKPLMCRADDEGHAQRLFIAGGTLCGKSFMASKLAKNYQTQFPKRKVIMFSWVDKDDNYDKIKNIHRIRVDDSILDDPIDLKELHDSVCIFDDIEHFTDKHIVSELERIRNSAMNAGRHKNIDVIVARQNMLDGHKTKTCLNSAFQVLGFPHSGGRYQLSEFLKKHMSMDKIQIQKILNLPSRWVLVNRSAPPYVLHEKGCFLLV